MDDVAGTKAGKTIPPGLKFHPEHTWARLDGDTALVGISDFAQGQLGEVIFIELPQVGDTVKKGQPFGNAESVKTVSALYAPLSGRVAAVNADLGERPELVNAEPYGAGWMIRVEADDAAELAELLTPEAYRQILQS
jgi:glycine cleavage system H protein